MSDAPYRALILLKDVVGVEQDEERPGEVSLIIDAPHVQLRDQEALHKLFPRSLDQVYKILNEEILLSKMKPTKTR